MGNRTVFFTVWYRVMGVGVQRYTDEYGHEFTDDERILKHLDGREVIGFLIQEMDTLDQESPVEFEMVPETPTMMSPTSL